MHGDPNSLPAVVLNIVGLLVVAAAAASALGVLCAAAWMRLARFRAAHPHHARAAPTRRRASPGGTIMNVSRLLYGGSATILGAWALVFFFNR